MQKFRFRVFRAIDDKASCIRFLEGHVKVLKDYGITNITTNNDKWMTNPSIYVIVAEREDNGDLVGGIRVHVADGREPLPLETAIGKMDARVYEIINQYIDAGTGELCGLWNAKDVAGMGLSLLLIRAGISIVTQIRLNSLFTICADYTLPMVKKVGFAVEDSIGKNGDFVYPNENYIAKVLRKMDAISLDAAEDYDRSRILDLRRHPEQDSEEPGPKGSVFISYRLSIK